MTEPNELLDTETDLLETSGGGTGSNDMVSVAAGTTPGYLSDVMKSDSDNLELNVVGNQLRLNLNLDNKQYEPKFDINYRASDHALVFSKAFGTIS